VEAGKNEMTAAMGALATITSCLNSLSKRLIQGECVPISSAIRLRGMVSLSGQKL
jgi:hypothetical protein